MKLSKILLAGATAALATTTAFAADVTVRMTGSTAFRASTMTGIRNYFTGASDLKIVATNASLNSANQATFRGTVGGKVVMIQCSWSGAMDGVRVVADTTNPTQANFLTEASLSADTVAGDQNHATIATSGNAESAVPDVAMGDSTQFETGYTEAPAYQTLVETPVGVIPFVWMKGKSNDAGVQAALNRVTNITNLQAQAVLAGFCPLSTLTGNAVDKPVTAYVVGRDYGSGTRLDTFLECGFGRDAFAVQYTYTVNAGSITALTENSESTDGYSSGSFLRTAVGTSTNAALTDAAVLSYMGISDAAAVSGITFDNQTGTFGGAAATQVLPFNGVPYSHEAVRNGAYTFWNYQVLMHRASLTGDKLAAVNAIKQQIIDADAAVGGIKLDTMKVRRAASGKVIEAI